MIPLTTDQLILTRDALISHRKAMMVKLETYDGSRDELVLLKTVTELMNNISAIHTIISDELTERYKVKP
jgi:hypothetical protein